VSTVVHFTAARDAIYNLEVIIVLLLTLLSLLVFLFLCWSLWKATILKKVACLHIISLAGAFYFASYKLEILDIRGLFKKYPT